MNSNRKISKKIIAVALSLIMVLGIVPTGIMTSVFASDITEEGTETAPLYAVTVSEDIKMFVVDETEEGTEIASGTELAAGTEIYVLVEDVENKVANVTPEPTAVDGNKYFYTVGEEALDIEVTYSDLTYTIEVNVTKNGTDNNENGTVNPSPITVNKTDPSTVVTIVPDAHYHISSLEFNGVEKVAELVEEDGNVFKYTIDNSEINADGTLSVTFERNKYSVELVCDDKMGTLEKSDTNVDLSTIDPESTLEFKYTSVNGYAIKSIIVNGKVQNITKDILDDEKFSVQILSDTTIEVVYSEIDSETLKDTKISDVFDLKVTSDSYIDNDNIYLANDNSVSIELNAEFAEKYNVIGFDLTSKEISDENKNNVLNAYDNQTSNDVITEFKVKTYDVNTKEVLTYAVPGIINVFVDDSVPEITLDGNDYIAYQKETPEISFKAIDKFDKYNNVSYASGVKSISAKSSYTNILNNLVEKNVDLISNDDGSYSFKAAKVPKYAGEVKYTITVIDNVGNKIEKIVTVGNDTVAPELKMIEFKNDQNSIFKKILSAISFGKYNNNTITVNVTATDAGSGLDGGEAKAYIRFKTSEDVIIEDESFNAAFNKDGEAQITVSKELIEKDGKVFKGVVEYRLVDKVGNGTGNDTSNDTSNDEVWLLVDNKKSNIGENNSGIMMIESNIVAPVINFISSLNTTNPQHYSLSVNETVNEIYNDNVQFDFTVTDAESGIYSYNVDINGETVNPYIDETETKELNESDIKYEITSSVNAYVNTNNIKANNDGSYNIRIELTDNAGNFVETTDTVYVDKTAAIIKGFDFNPVSKDINKNDTSKLFDAVEVTDYGFYFKEKVTVKIYADDIKNENEIASGVKSITYRAVDIDGNTPYESDDSTKLQSDDNGIYVEFVIDKDFKGQIYAFATDNVENSCSEVHPNGSIFESADKHTAESHIEITASAPQGTQNTKFSYTHTDDTVLADEEMAYDIEQNVPLYNGNPTFDIKVGDTYSGIRNIKCTVIDGEGEREVENVTVDNVYDKNNTETIGNWNVTFDEKSNLVSEMSTTITVDGNYNDMVLLAELTDRAGNKSYDYYAFGIDKTAPSIEVEYDNNAGDSQSGTGAYFKANRTATITVSERNFNKENVNFIIKNAEGSAPAVSFVKDIEGAGNGDDTKHVFTVTYGADGVYSFDMNYTDRATNVNNAIDYKDSFAPTNFIVDKTAPTIAVSYDNNDAQNSKYFKANRTATIVVREHNFDVNRVVITGTAALDNSVKAFPVATWVNNGDTHIATINYNEDGDYTFAIAMDDKAGNAITDNDVDYGSSVAAKDFTVDTNWSDIVTVDGIVDKGIIDAEDDKIQIHINDINLEDYNIQLTRSRVFVDSESKEVEREKIDYKSVIDGSENQFDNNAIFKTEQGTENTTVTIDIPKKDNDGIKNDGLYRLTIEAKDKAGNAYDTNANIITFSVNRYGSVFTFSQDLYDLISENNGYTTFSNRVSGKDLAVYEYNSTVIKKQQVDVISNNDSRTLVEGNGYTVDADESKNEKLWNMYTYHITPETFKDDGIYTLRVSSTDEAEINSQTASYDVCSANFVVDNHAPVISAVTYSTQVNKVLNKDNEATAKTDDLNVLFTVEDVMKLKSISVLVDGSEIISKNFEEELSGNVYSDEIPLSVGKHDFQIVAVDKADNIIDTKNGVKENGSSEYTPFEHGYVFYDTITVTTNQFVIWAKSSPVFWGIVGGVAVLALGIIIFVVVKKRKKDDEEDQNKAQS